MTQTETLCHCGKPLHYSNQLMKEYVEYQVNRLGETIRVTSLATGKTYLVQRHYIALHGLKEAELDELGFEEIKTA